MESNIFFSVRSLFINKQNFLVGKDGTSFRTKVE